MNTQQNKTENISLVDEINPEPAIKSLDALFFAWLGSEGCSDQETSIMERAQIGYDYKTMRSLLVSLQNKNNLS